MSILAFFVRRSGSVAVLHRVQPRFLGANQYQKMKGIGMKINEAVKGPASYFPSIEKKYGESIDHWMGVLNQAGPLKHMELVGHLKTEHQIGRGHANALVAWFLAK